MSKVWNSIGQVIGWRGMAYGQVVRVLSALPSELDGASLMSVEEVKKQLFREQSRLLGI